RRISLAPRRERLFERLLSILEEDGAIVRESGSVRLLRAAPMNLPAIRREIESRSPELAGLCDLLDRAAGALPQVLSGEIEGLAVLYPEGGPAGATLFEKVPGDFRGVLPEVPGDFSRANLAGEGSDSKVPGDLQPGASQFLGTADLPTRLI